MVQKGKFSAGAALLVKTLKNVDLPTFGTPKRRCDQSMCVCVEAKVHEQMN